MGRTKNPPKRQQAQNDEASSVLAGRIVTGPDPSNLLLEDWVQTLMGTQPSTELLSDHNPPPAKKKDTRKRPPTKNKTGVAAAVATAEEPPARRVKFSQVNIAKFVQDGAEDERWELQFMQDEPNVRIEPNWTLRVYQLIRTSFVCGAISTSSKFVRTEQDAACLLEHCEACCCEDQETEAKKLNVKDVALCVGEGTLVLECREVAPQVVHVAVSLTERSFDFCSATFLSPPARRRNSKKYRPVSNLLRALASLFPDTIVADVVATLSRSSDSISAKKVYNLIDNVKLNEYEANGGYDSKPMSIPGLVPTLRPYQEAAVKWMLRRERQEEKTNQEWELAWFVLSNLSYQGAVQPPFAMKIVMGEVVAVPDWKKHKQCTVIETQLLFCPFFGFLATSGVDAYQQTLDSFLLGGRDCEWTYSSGGILAESMGLGKTVEVLACILANRLQPTEQKKKKPMLLDAFDEEADDEMKNVGGTERSQVEELHDPMDVESEEFEFEEESSATQASQNQDDVRAIVTPEKAGIRNCFEEWNHSWGACICGRSGSFRGSLSIVMCTSCRRPMHGICAGYHSVEEIQSDTSWRVDPESTSSVQMCSSERCPSCVFARIHATGELIQSRATLIITPTPILSQWERELRRHTMKSAEMTDGEKVSEETASEDLKIVVYPGIRKICEQNRSQIQLMHPSTLADADIILMTFDSLMGELGHSSSDENPYLESAGQRLRSTKKYRVAPSPLASIRWWRICLDEAQRVETPTATSARMAQKLVSQHSWCVSGTPIGRGKMDDLYGLFLFLRIGPFSNKEWFQRCLRSCHRGFEARIKHLLSSAIWRSTKASESVTTQMLIPAQVERKILLNFSSIERHFYDRQLEETLLVAGDVFARSHAGRKRKTADDLLAGHLHRLRAACCHPQVGSSGIGRPKRKRRMLKSHSEDGGDVSVGSSVLTMEQILDRLIDDAKSKCEEAQRLAIMHTNAMASLQQLKVEAKKMGVSFSESDDQLYWQSCQTYMESLDLTDSNAMPSDVYGEAMLVGSSGFLSNRKLIRDGRARLQWQMRTHVEEEGTEAMREVWSRIDFEGPARRIIEVKLRPTKDLPIEMIAESKAGGAVKVVIPKTVVFQVSNAALGGEFVDVATFSLGGKEEHSDGQPLWMSRDGFRTNKSKSWRVVVKEYYEDNERERRSGAYSVTVVVGLEIQLLEADIAADSLQRLHVLHNASLTMTLLLQKDSGCVSGFMNPEKMRKKVEWMQSESSRIESLYMDMARSVHRESQRRLHAANGQRLDVEEELRFLSHKVKQRRSLDWADCWDDEWWEDLMSLYILYGPTNERLALCDRVRRDLDDFVYNTLEGKKHESRVPGSQRYKDFSTFHSVPGLKAALSFRFSEFRTQSASGSYSACLESIARLSSEPCEEELFENSHCGKCRKDWNQTGPECRHCKLESTLNKTSYIDPLLLTILRSLSRIESKAPKLLSARKEARIDARMEKFFMALDATEKATRTALVAWRTHFDLLSDLDEMNQCKRTIRLAAVGEDISKLSPDELGSVVFPWDISARYMDHGAKQAMALANLSRNKSTLRYLKNQSKECEEELKDEGGSNQCPLCLSSFATEYAVLACGHRFHYSPCLEKLISRRGGHSISCPLRCSLTTKRSAIMIATKKRRDDGSKSNREVKGSWGTKVTKLVADVMDVSELGEKSIVFSQWEDMLEVVEHALEANGVTYVRSMSSSKMGEAIRSFRSSDCTVLLMNVKNGAEGLTIVEATHIFMVEPLLNCGLDSQAISRIHRIGQTRKTYVHRYLIQDTIEMKIDSIRTERLATDQLEDSLFESRQKHDVSAGGIDGGFSQDELQELLR